MLKSRLQYMINTEYIFSSDVTHTYTINIYLFGLCNSTQMIVESWRCQNLSLHLYMKMRVHVNAFVRFLEHCVALLFLSQRLYGISFAIIVHIITYRKQPIIACNALLRGDNSSLFFSSFSKQARVKKKKKWLRPRRREMWKTGSCDKSTITRRAKYKFYPTAMASRVYPFMCVHGG